MWWIWIAVACVVVFTVLWWLINTTEGSYLGRRVVIMLYDRYATRYDSAKARNDSYEYAYLAHPLLHYAQHIAPHVLDIATGTGRVPRALFAHKRFAGSVVALDLSEKMLEIAAEHLRESLDAGHTTLLKADATMLHFPDNSFDVVTCLEALEFLPDATRTLREIVRVTRPGGMIALTNRQGIDTWLFPGKAMTNKRFATMLQDTYGLKVLALQPEWSELYALFWVRVLGNATPIGPTMLEDCLQCPNCTAVAFYPNGQAWICQNCGTIYPITDVGIIHLGD